VTSIGSKAYDGCTKVKTLTIGKSVSTIGEHAFAGFDNLTDVTCYAEEVPKTDRTAFEYSYIEHVSLHVPKYSIGSYKESGPWKFFKEILTIEGSSFSVIYVVNGETYKTVSYDYGATITPEAAPTKEGYTFSGWSNIPSTMPSEDVTVTGSFNVNYYKLTYIVDGVEYKSIEQEYGTHITPEEEPVKDGCTFSGWSEIPGSMPAHDVTVTGTFTKASYILTYVINGETYKTVSYDYGATITPEAAPTKEGYTFLGWSWIPSKMPDEDVTITGFFTVNKYKLTYMIDGKVYKEVEVEYGAKITPEPQPTGDFVSFSWTGLPETMPARDVTVQADYVTGIIDVQRAKSGTQTGNRYDMGGRKMSGQPKKGVNIIRYQNGTTKKVVMK